MANDTNNQYHSWRGVNLGGWLVLEKWITPSLFAGMQAADEYSFCEQADTLDFERLKAHYKNFVTVEDFKWLKDHGINTVRIPVGYWIFGDAAPYKGATEYLDFAMQWAEQYDIKVLIDLHGAPESQNGWDHSGHIGKIGWPKNERNTALTLQAIDRLSKRYCSSTALLGIELMNEPHWKIPRRKLKNYYEQAYKIVRRNCGENTWVVMHDGFKPRRYKSVLCGKEYVRVAIDTHRYQAYGRNKKLPIIKHLKKVLKRWQKDIVKMQKKHPVIIGEWSTALDQQSTNGFTTFQRNMASQAYGAAQLVVFEETLGGFYFTYKTEAAGRWNFRYCLENNLLAFAAN